MAIAFFHNSKRLQYISVLIAVVRLQTIQVVAADHKDSFQQLHQEYDNSIQPLIASYCLDCHSTAASEGELDLERYSAFAEIRNDPQVWQKVAEMLSNGEMPPEESPQPSSDELKQLSSWVKRYLDTEARANAGDPGPVVLRRLNNAEYTYTIRDLTGVALNPTEEFPIDNAAGEGFTNTGSAQAMSPAMFDKYLAAAKKISQHMVLLPDGIRFSKHDTRRDHTDEILTAIRQLYFRYTGSLGNAEQLNRWDVSDPTILTNSDGRVDLESYFRFLIKHREQIVNDHSALDTIINDTRLSKPYVQHLAEMLTSKQSSLLLDRLRLRWQAANEDSAADIAQNIRAWQNALWKFNPVGHFGQVKGWQEPVDLVKTVQDLRLHLKPQAEEKQITFYLSAGTAGDVSTTEKVVWNNPHILRPEQPPLSLTDIPQAIDPQHISPESKNITAITPSTIEIKIPADLAADAEFVVQATLADDSPEASAQFSVATTVPKYLESLSPAAVVVNPNSTAEAQYRQAFDDFRQLFPSAMCYPRIVPVDVVVTFVLYYREDDQLKRLMLNDQERETLEQLWNELHYVGQTAFKMQTVYEQLLEFASQDDDPNKYKPLGEEVRRGAKAYRAQLLESESSHLDSLIEFADRAYRRPLDSDEIQSLHDFYQQLRTQQLPHDEALKLTLTRILTSAAFLYKLETPSAGKFRNLVSNHELASRLSYFLWSSAPDDDLRQAASQGLQTPETILNQTQRMLQNEKVRRLAIEFACQWLHIRDFDKRVEKSERHFPTFANISENIYQEPIHFFADLFKNDGSVLEILNADYTFLNEALAKHYGIPGVQGDHWRRVDQLRSHSRGGILAQAAILASQSGASRTSPILRGNWISETILGERLPRPPKDVPVLPESVPEGLTERQLIAQHSSDPACAKCHARIDPYGFALESYDTIGRFRETDARGHPIDTRSTLLDGTIIDGLADVRTYLLTARRHTFVRQFCKKLLGYALGRAVQLSDEPLLDDMMQKLAENDYRVSQAIQSIVLSEQFRMIRGQDYDKNNLTEASP